MAGVTLTKGKQIYSSGQPMSAVHLIVKGSVTVEYPGGTFMLGKGDVIGIGEICSDVHFLNYVANEDTTILTYPVSDMDVLETFLTKHPDVARLFLTSLFHQIHILMEQNNASEIRCADLHQNLVNDYNKYQSLCTRYHITPRVLEDTDHVLTYINDEVPDLWLNSYYLGLKQFYSGDNAKQLLSTPGVSIGMVRKGSLDFRRTFTVFEERNLYSNQVIHFYYNDSCNDLFDLMTSLYYRLGQNNEDADVLKNDIERVIETLENISGVKDFGLSSRIQNYQNNMMRTDAKQASEEKQTDSITSHVLKELSGSMNTILEYSMLPQDFCVTLRKNLNSYNTLKDKNSMEPETVSLRKQLTNDFYTLYEAVFEHASKLPYQPIPIRMFLYFGYIDEDMTSRDDLLTLYNMSCSIEDKSEFGLYTFYHWLLAILNGSKRPSRNEFEEDFDDYIRICKQENELSSDELLELENDPMKRVQYELHNMFPQVNKMTCGSITTFCPFFSSENVLKSLSETFVTITQITKAFEEIKAIDYSAFYRESLDLENAELMGKRNIHLEFMPDFILMPNVGMRGVMWQEIDGKVRNSAGRMCCSIFHMENLTNTIIKMTGELRWELCRRIQGSRWSDVSLHSLTADYADYIQFYRKNPDLSAEVKEKLKANLQRAKNSTKEMFVRDYIIWILFEGNGSPRLNKVARRILITHCPLSADLANIMEKNPLYTELISRQKTLAKQQLHQLDNLKQKIKNMDQRIPETLIMEYAYWEGHPI